MFFLLTSLRDDYVGATFQYKRPASRGNSLRQHGLLVAQLTVDCPYTLQWVAPSPLKIALPVGDQDPHLIHPSP